MGSQNATCHPTHVNTPNLNPSQIYLPWRNGRQSRPRWPVKYPDGLSIHRRSPIHIPGVELTTCCHKSGVLTTTLRRHQIRKVFQGNTGLITCPFDVSVGGPSVCLTVRIFPLSFIVLVWLSYCETDDVCYDRCQIKRHCHVTSGSSCTLRFIVISGGNIIVLSIALCKY